MVKKTISEGHFIAFLFDADHDFLTKKYNYATPCQNELLKAISLLEQLSTFNARVRHGDVLIHNLASKPSKVKFFPKPVDPTKTAWTSSSHQGKIDKRVLYTAINELESNLSSKKNSTIDLEYMWQKLLMHNIYCLSLYPINFSAAKFIDKHFESFPPYLGMADLDKESQLHIKLFAELPDCGYFKESSMIMPSDIWDEDHNSFGSEGQKIIPTIRIPFSKYRNEAPIFPSIANISKKMADEVNNLNEVMKNNHSERIAKELLSKFNSETQPNLILEFSTLKSDQEHLKIPIEKLLKYALNMDHEKGKHKAYLFHHILGIDSSQWRYLAYQIINESNRAEILQLEVNEHGIKYVTIIEVHGLNGRKATVKAAWRISNNISQLVTVYPEKNTLTIPRENAALPPLILKNNNNENYWQAIFEAANIEGTKSAKECIPEPMIWQSSFNNHCGIEPEGKCGYAYITLTRDSGFAEWILRNNLGTFSRHFNQVKIDAKSKSQSLDREKAYANAFSKVLWLNGIDNIDIEYILT